MSGKMNKRQRKKRAKKIHNNHPFRKTLDDLHNIYNNIIINQILFGTAIIKVEWDKNTDESEIKVLTYKEMSDLTFDNLIE